jgi:hypothetical protein
VKVSLLGLYKEELSDLLSDDKKDLRIFEVPLASVVCFVDC